MKKITLSFVSRVLRGVALVLILPVAAVLRGADVANPEDLKWPELKIEMPVRSEQQQGIVLDPAAALKKAIDAKKKNEPKMPRRMDELPTPDDDYDWKRDAAWRDLSEMAVDSLAKNKAAFGRSVEQSFSPYLGGPVFVTSDSLLNAFHVLFEDSFREMELHEARHFTGALETLLKNARALQKNGWLGFPEERYRAALKHAQLVLGPAIVLAGGSLATLDDGVRDEVLAQVQKINRAGTTELPSWLSPEDENSLLALDYRLCKPVGLYTSSESLASYFRAVRWLQMVPFRGSRLVEMDAAVLLGLADAIAGETGPKPGICFQRIARLMGHPDDPSPFDLAGFLDKQSPREFRSYDCALPEVRTAILNRIAGGDYYKINSDLRRTTTAKDSFDNIVVRLIPETRLQDAVLFQRLMDSQIAPSGLAFAAMLHSSFAEKKLSAAKRKIVEDAREEMEMKHASGAGSGEGLEIYEQYVRTLRTLFARPAPGAPDFMRTEFWEAKSCQTALAGWAQMRHTFTLQAKRAEYYLALLELPPGFVEPNPEFFARMSRLLEAVTGYLEANNFFVLAETTDADGKRSQFRKRWDSLSALARTLENLALKELLMQPWSLEDEKFLKSYGAKLGLVMGYFGNSYDVPRDDAPRWVEVARDTQRDTALAVAVGRPRYLYVLYPWNGMEILCQGSVMQYYEYDAKGTPLTDGEWLKLLDSPEAPSIPEWLRPFADAPRAPAAR